MADTDRKTRIVRASGVIGAGLACSFLALGAAFAQTPADAPADAVAADAAATPETPQTGAMTRGQRVAAQAAADLAAGIDDEPVILEAPAPNSRRVYINDPAHFGVNTQQFVIDTEAGEVIGIVDGGFLPNPVVADDGSLFAHASTVFSRIARGTRTDYIEVFDPVTFRPTADIELPVEAHRFLVGTYPWMTALTPDNSTLLYYQFSPAPSVGVVDLEGKQFSRLMEMPDCYHIFPVAADTFYMHCRDGNLARVQFEAQGEAEPQITHSEVFRGEEDHVVNHPAFSQKTGRLVWPTYTGKIYQFDLNADQAQARNTIEGLTAEELADGWAPGGWQLVAYHRPSDRIYMLVDQRAEWTHKTASRYLLVIDAATGQRITRLELGHDIDSVALSQDDNPLLYGLSTGDKTLYIYDAETGEELRSVDQLGHGPQVISLADMG